MKEKTTKMLAMLLAICTMIGCFVVTPVTASAASNGGEITIPRTYLEVVKNGKSIDVVCWAEEDGKIYLPSYSALQKLFPEETSGMSFIDVLAPVNLAPYAEQFGYRMKMSGKKLNLSKSTSDDGEITVPRTYLDVLKNGNAVNVSAWLEENGLVYLSGYSALQKLFPEETSGMSFVDLYTPIRLEPFTRQFGYTFEVIGKTLRISKAGASDDDDEVTTYLPVYRDGRATVVTAWQEEDGQIWIQCYSELYEIFAEETQELVFPAYQVPILLEPYVDQFGCTMQVKNGNLYVKTASTSPSKEIQIWINGKKLEVPKNIPYPYVVNGTTLVPARLVTEALGAKVDWLRAVPNDIVTITREGTELILHVNSTWFSVNGVAGKSGTPAVYKDGSTMLQLRVIVESFKNASIAWNGRLNRIFIVDSFML